MLFASLLLTLLLLSPAALADSYFIPPYFNSQPFENIRATLAASTTWQNVMEAANALPGTFVFGADYPTVSLPITCDVGGSATLTCSWYFYNKTTLAFQAITSGYSITNVGQNVNCKLTSVVTAAQLNNTFICSATSSATNQVAYSDPFTFIPIGSQLIAPITVPQPLNTYAYYMWKNPATSALLPMTVLWYVLNMDSACSGSSGCTQSFASTRFAFDDSGSLHMLQLLSSDVPYTQAAIICEARVASQSVQSSVWKTYYQLPQPPVIAGTVPNSPTATLKYVSGAGSITSGSNTASGTLNVMEGQLSVTLACIYSSKSPTSPIQVIFSKVGTGVLGNATSGSYLIGQVALSDGGQYQCYEVAAPTAVSSITLVVQPKLRWPTYTPRYFVQVNSSNAIIDASTSVGPSAITFTWSVGGTSVGTGSTVNGWMLTSNSQLKYTLVANMSQSMVIQVSLQSGSQARNYAVAFVVVMPISLTTSPFSPTTLSLWNPSTTYSYVAFATGDTRVTTSGRVNYAWIYLNMPLSSLQTTTTCGVDPYATADPSGYVVVWDSGNSSNVTQTNMTALSFTQDVSAGTATMNVITGNVNNRDNYRGCYCMRAYTIASRFYQCAPFAFAGEVTPAVLAVAVFPWWAIVVIVVVAILLLIIFLIVLFFVVRRRGGTYNVDEKERQQGNDPERELRDTGFKEHVRSDTDQTVPLGAKAPGDMNQELQIGSEDGDALDEYGEHAANPNSALLAAKGFEEGSVVGQYARQPTMQQQQQQQQQPPIPMQPMMGTGRAPSTTLFQPPIQPPMQQPPPAQYGYGTYNAAANTNTPRSQPNAFSPPPAPQVPPRPGPGGPVPAYAASDPRPPSGASYNAPPIENPPFAWPANSQAGGGFPSAQRMASPLPMDEPPRVPGRPYAPAQGNYSNNPAAGDVV